MSFNQSKLYASVADPANQSLSSTDLATKLNVTTRKGIDLRTLDAYLCGTARSATDPTCLRIVLETAAADATLPPPLMAGAASFLKFVYSPLQHETLDYADPEIGGKVDQVLAGLVQATRLDQSQADAITAMGTVWSCDGPVQTSDVDATRATFALDQQRASVGNWISQNAQTAQGMADAWRAAGAFPADWKMQIQTTAFDPTK